MKTSVLDSFSLLAFFGDEAGAATVEKILVEALSGKRSVLLSLVNWGELYYVTLRRLGRETVNSTVDRLSSMPIEVVQADFAMTRLAAEIKATHKLAYADAYAVALAKMRHGEVVTGDPEFRAVENTIVPIHWIRRVP